MIPARGKRLKRKKRDKIDYTTRKNVVCEYFVIEKKYNLACFFLAGQERFSVYLYYVWRRISI